jgi:hypothetical protein
VLIISKDDALENTVALLRRWDKIRAHFMTPTSIHSHRDLAKRLPSSG